MWSRYEMTTYTMAYLVHRWVATGRRQSEVKGKSKSERARVDGRWSHNRLLSDQHPERAEWTLSFKLVRKHYQLKRRKRLRGSTGEQRGSTREQ